MPDWSAHCLECSGASQEHWLLVFRHWIIIPCQGQPVLDVLLAASMGNPLSCVLLCPSSLSRLSGNN